MKKSPVLIHIPHASTYIPPKEKKFFIPQDLQPELLRMTDLYVDELFDTGDASIVFPISRLVCDVERMRDDADEPMAAKGMGLAYTRCADGSPLRNISPQKKGAIARMYYDKHHELFTDAVNEKLHEFGECVIIDAHSFPAEPLPYEDDASRPDFCIGTDPFHTPYGLLELCADFLRSCGFKVSINRPFSGTIVPMEHLYSDPDVYSVMIEINRRLYMDSQGNKTQQFEMIKRVTAELVRRVGEHYTRGASEP